MIWFLIALAWFVGFGISMRKRMTKLIDKSYQEALDCKWCDIYRRTPRLKEETCASHEQEYYGMDVVGCVLMSIIWPTTTGWWLFKQGFTRTFFSRSGKIKSKARERWNQEIQSARTAYEFETAQKKYAELEGGKAPVAKGEPTSAEIRDAIENDRLIRRMRTLRSYY